MSSSLPTESALDKTVETFGLGTYDYPQSGFEHGEDSNKKKSGESLPQDGGPLDPFGPDRLLSYPQTVATSMVPGDIQRPPRHKTPPPSHLDSVVHSVSNSRLPPEDASVTRTDYYDKMTTANLVNSLDDMFSNSGDDTYTASEEEVAEEEEEEQSDFESIPSAPSNYISYDNVTAAPGNYWSGFTVQDQAVPAGFPSTEFENPQRYQKTNASMKKEATNHNLVRSLTGEFLKSHGRKGLTRRHVMGFLQNKNAPQYLASDIVRCLNLDYNLYVKDVLDLFPVYKTASSNRLSSLRDKLISLEIENIRDPEISMAFRTAAAALSKTIALLEQAGVQNA